MTTDWRHIQAITPVYNKTTDMATLTNPLKILNLILVELYF